ncbi:hypothetical protein MNB_SV-13-40 [hydrothermal vent metagenome]|uniref:Uncharacterized protein n=1 Tax=hydrothermal vent metagenome TaxID=652676 RepID=A0A1W1CZG3_9ZZZZ
MFDIQYSQHFKKEDFYILNAKVCNDLQEKYNLDKSYRLKIKD